MEGQTPGYFTRIAKYYGFSAAQMCKKVRISNFRFLNAE